MADCESTTWPSPYSLDLPPERKESMATTGRHMLIAALGIMTPDLTLHLPSEKQREVDM